MKKSRRKILLTVAVLLLVTLYITGVAYIVGSMKFSETDSAKHYVAIITKSTTSNFWKTVQAGANAASTEYNLTITFEGPDNEEDYLTQNEMIRRAVENGAEVIIFSAVDYNANADAINDAANQGVKIVIIDSDVNSGQISARISTDNYDAGRMAGDAVLAVNESEINVGIVNYDINSANGQQREQGFRDWVTDDSRVNIVETINVISTTEDAMQGAIEMLERHPEINVLVTFNEWTSLGVGYAIKELELGDETMVVAFDSNVVSVGMLETGEVDALIVQNPFAMGYLGVEAAYNLIFDFAVEAEIVTETTTVTKDNMFNEEHQKVLFNFD